MLVCAEEFAQEGDLVVAIDFGTSRTAVAYTIVGFDDELVTVIRLSGAASYVQGDFKASTSVLIDKGKVRAFGFDAEQTFAADERESSAEWMLFKWFKMNLHQPAESDPLVNCFGGGAQLRLSEVLEKCLEYVKREVLHQLKLQGLVHSEDASELFWVLTVPAIWSDHAKYMMRTAALKAGLIRSEQSSHLLLALEPECAAIASQRGTRQQRLLGQGTKFLIADCGGGTLDVTSHEVVQSSPLRLKELAQPVGGPFGATLVDEEFFDFFQNLVGRENFDLLRRKEPAEYLDLVKEWEQKKLMFRFDGSSEDWTLLNVSNAVHAMGIEAEFRSMVDSWNNRNRQKTVKRPSRKTKLALSFELMASFFEDVVSNIVEQISSAVHSCPGLDYVVMAGGFSTCDLLQERVRERFDSSSVNVIVASDPHLAIVKGAAMFGARPTATICSRKARYTFGIQVSELYDGGDPRHRAHKDKVYLGGDGAKLLELFSVHGRVGDDIEVCQNNKLEYFPDDDTQCANIRILTNEKRDVLHVSEEGVKELAVITVPFDMTVPFEDRSIQVQFSFGGPEIRCVVYNAAGNREIGSVPLPIKFFNEQEMNPNSPPPATAPSEQEVNPNSPPPAIPKPEAPNETTKCCRSICSSWLARFKA